MKKIKKFPFNDVVLLSKGWYGQTTEKTFMRLVARCLAMSDDYYIKEDISDDEVAHWMLIALDKIHSHLIAEELRYGRWIASPLRFEEEVNRKIRLCNVDRNEAITLAVLNVMMMLDNKEIELELPRYGKGLPRYTGGTFSNRNWQPITYSYMRKNAERFFCDRKKDEMEKREAIGRIIGSLQNNEPLRNWYFTFGVGHPTNAKKYVRIMSRNYEDARQRMFDVYGANWAFDYSEEDWVINPKKNPKRWQIEASWYHLDPNRTEPITQAELYGLEEIFLGVVK